MTYIAYIVYKLPQLQFSTAAVCGLSADIKYAILADRHANTSVISKQCDDKISLADIPVRLKLEESHKIK